jgi:hypothetical protein
MSLALLAGCQSGDVKQASGSSSDSAARQVASAQTPVMLETTALDPSLPYQATKSNPVTYEVDFSAVVMPPPKSKVLKVWLPLPQTDSAQEVTEGELSSFPMKVEPKIGTEKLYGNKFAYFEFKDASGAQVVRHKFKVKVYELHWNLDPAKIKSVASWPASFSKYLRHESQAVVVDGRFDKLVDEIVPHPGNPLNDMTSVMDYVIKDFKYDHNVASLHASSSWAIDNHEGHCSDYHGFCSAMGRALHSPTRVTYGMNPFPKNSPSHCKMEAYLAPYGWVSFDVSETQNLLGLIARTPDLDEAHRQHLSEIAKDRLIHGFRDNTWFLQTRGTDYDLAPPAAHRVAVVRTIYAEADGVEIPDSDPAASNTKAYTWMTVQDFKPDHPVSYTFKDIKSLEAR